MANNSNLQKTGMQMLLGRERFEALMAEADRVGLSMATVVRTGIDAWMELSDEERHYQGEARGQRVVDVAAREKDAAREHDAAREQDAAREVTQEVAPTPRPGPRLAEAFRRAPHDPRPFG